MNNWYSSECNRRRLVITDGYITGGDIYDIGDTFIVYVITHARERCAIGGKGNKDKYP